MDEEGQEPLIRAMALNALCYCERLFYLEEVEGIELADESVYAGRRLHEELKPEDVGEEGEWSEVYVSSESLGLTGKADCIKRRDGALIPYEHKRGKSKRIGEKPVPWEADAVQVAAYAMLIEEETGEIIPEGRIRYHADNVTVRVPIDDQARFAVNAAIERGRELRSLPERPPVSPNDRLCIRCSLAPVCLPEEERLAEDEDWQPVRLFPPDREVKTVHVTDPGARITRSGETLKIVPLDESPVSFPINEVGALVIHGFAQATTQAIHMCAYNGIPVHWISGGGRFIAALAADSGSVQRRLLQYKALSDEDFKLKLAVSLAFAKVGGQMRYILRATRESGKRDPSFMEKIDEIRSSLKRIPPVKSPDSLRGYEGTASRAYFEAVRYLISKNVDDSMRPDGRSRRPPRDRFNALLSFGYSLVYQAVMQAILNVGLDPSIGFFHTPRSSAHPLVMDVMELYRLPLWDMPLIGSVNRSQWDTATDFDIAGKRVWLSREGKKKAIRLFEARLDETWKHPVVGYSLSYSRLIELEIRLLEKEWSGKPGLFGRMRIR